MFSKHQNKPESKNLDDTEVLDSDFSGLITSVASLTSSPLQPHWPHRPRQPYIIKEILDPDEWIIPDTKLTNNCPYLLNGSSKVQFFTDI